MQWPFLVISSLALRRSFNRVYVDEFAVSAAFCKANSTGRRCEQCVVTTTLYIYTRMKFGATLAHDNPAGFNVRAAIDFNAEHFRIGIAAVLG